MKCIQTLISFVLFISLVSSSSFAGAAPKEENDHTQGKQSKDDTASTSSQSTNNLRGLQGSNKRRVTLNIQNLTYKQHFSTFFVMVHNDQAKPMYTLGDAPSKELVRLAENGAPGGLINYYWNKDRTGVKSATRYDPVTYGGKSSQITVTISDEYPLVSIAAMCENTNDCFVALNGVKVTNGMTIDASGLDAGSEENNESCDSVPGPACIGKGKRTQKSGNGEGYVHVHRGIGGDGDLDMRFDWRNPMMRVTVT